MPIPFAPGDTVSARGRLWRLRGLVDYGACAALDLEPAGSPPGAGRRVLLYPFDRVSRLDEGAAPGFVSRRRWWRQCAVRLLASRSCDALMSPVRAQMDLLPYQLEPALAMALRGVPRVLLADAVGLGKTIQAGITIAELFVRGDAQRALIIVPAGLRDQWASELRERFGFEADIIDSGTLRALGARLPPTVNPWSVPRVVVTSMDFAKRPEVIEGLSAVPWDILVVDEAHMATADSDRYRAMSRLADRAARLLLLTATPHSGDRAAFEALAALGAPDAAEPILLFRRSRRQAGLSVPRHMRLLRVRLSRAEHRCLSVLTAYARRVWAHHCGTENGAARLAMALLLKRALSSPLSLQRSAVRRRALLEARDESAPRQLDLPLDEELDRSDDDTSAVLGARGLERLDEERAWLDDIVSATAFAVREHRKVRAICRLLRRVREPAIVFTEYRDTLAELEAALGGTRQCVSLHGGMDRVDREAALSAFSSGQADVLLATDAGGVGLNLHGRCRLVINLELPWNPVRLEQRIGRVDRIGQSRTVHAIQTIGRATAESRVLARLIARVDRARTALGDAEPAWHLAPGELDTAETVLGLRLPSTLWALAAGNGGASDCRDLTTTADLSRLAAFESARLLQHRTLDVAVWRGGSTPASPGVCLRGGRCLVAFARFSTRSRDAGRFACAGLGCLAIFAARLVNLNGRLWDELLLPLRLDASIARPRSRREARELAGRLASELPAVCADHLDRAIAARRDAVQRWADESARYAPLHSRNAGDGDDAGAIPDTLFQPGLFDGRAERAARDVRHEPIASRIRTPGLTGRPGASALGPTIMLAGPPRLSGLLIVTR